MHSAIASRCPPSTHHFCLGSGELRRHNRREVERLPRTRNLNLATHQIFGAFVQQNRPSQRTHSRTILRKFLLCELRLSATPHTQPPRHCCLPFCHAPLCVGQLSSPKPSRPLLVCPIKVCAVATSLAPVASHASPPH